MNPTVDLAVAILLILFCFLGAFDGLYFHLIKYRLHEHPESRQEHILHTLRGFGFVPITLLLFVVNTSGALLYFAAFFVLVDFALELFDILEEKRSRARFGGISSAESAIHVFASSFRLAAIALVFAFKPAAAYDVSAPLLLTEFQPTPMAVMGILLAVGSFFGSIHSIWDYRTCVICKVDSSSSPKGTASAV